MINPKLSVLSNASEGTVSYYVGDDIEHIKHLRNCTLICRKRFEALENVEQIIVADPQLYFYQLSNEIDNTYTFEGKNIEIGENCLIHPSAVIGDNVRIGDRCEIGPNSVLYSKTEVGNETRIGSNSTIGAEGMMWTWGKNKKIFLRQVGGVIIQDNCIIGSNSAIVRGSANELTTIRSGVNMAPGCNVGHGTFIGEQTHFANNITIGGTVSIGPYNFLGCASIINPRVKIDCSDVIIGAGGVVTKSIYKSGIYFGSPAKRIGDVKDKMMGVPSWNR